MTETLIVAGCAGLFVLGLVLGLVVGLLHNLEEVRDALDSADGTERANEELHSLNTDLVTRNVELRLAVDTLELELEHTRAEARAKGEMTWG